MKIIIGLFILAGIIMLFAFKSRLHDSQYLQSNDQPDKPISFGYKCVWVTVKAQSSEEVANFLGLRNQRNANWKNGIDKAYGNEIFISPPIDGFIFIVGTSLPTADSDLNIKKAKALIDKLSLRYQTADFFVTHRVVDLHGWMKSQKGETVRAYVYLGESGDNLIVEGKELEIEKQLNLVNTFSSEAKLDNYFSKPGLTFPDEGLVMKIAEKWSVNPSTLGQRKDLKEGLGITGRL
jgi:hypothetical protein